VAGFSLTHQGRSPGWRGGWDRARSRVIFSSSLMRSRYDLQRDFISPHGISSIRSAVSGLAQARLSRWAISPAGHRGLAGRPVDGRLTWPAQTLSQLVRVSCSIASSHLGRFACTHARPGADQLAPRNGYGLHCADEQVVAGLPYLLVAAAEKRPIQ